MKFINENDEIYTPIPQWYNIAVEMARNTLREDWNKVHANVDIDMRPSVLERTKNRWEEGKVGETIIARYMDYPADRVRKCLHQRGRCLVRQKVAINFF
jgi:hypothetical protein